MGANQSGSRSRMRYSFLKIMAGSDLAQRRLPMMEARGSRTGPTVWVTGCVHGDEVGGIVVIQELFKRLKRRSLRRGRVCAFPLMNPIGFESVSRHIGLSREDLNRSFPGNPRGSVAERIAEQIFTTIMATGPALVLDLHNDWIRSIPYALLDPDEPGQEAARRRVVELARQTGLPPVQEPRSGGSAIDHRTTLTGSLLARGIAALTLELGESYVVNEEMVQVGLEAVWRVLAALGMVTPEENDAVPVSEPVRIYSHEPVASTSGIVRFAVQPGQRIAAGAKVARVYNVFGKLQETIVAPKPGIVLGYSDTSVAMPGLPIAAFAHDMDEPVG